MLPECDLNGISRTVRLNFLVYKLLLLPCSIKMPSYILIFGTRSQLDFTKWNNLLLTIDQLKVTHTHTNILYIYMYIDMCGWALVQWSSLQPGGPRFKLVTTFLSVVIRLCAFNPFQTRNIGCLVHWVALYIYRGNFSWESHFMWESEKHSFVPSYSQSNHCIISSYDVNKSPKISRSSDIFRYILNIG